MSDIVTARICLLSLMLLQQQPNCHIPLLRCTARVYLVLYLVYCNNLLHLMYCHIPVPLMYFRLYLLLHLVYCNDLPYLPSCHTPLPLMYSRPCAVPGVLQVVHRCTSGRVLYLVYCHNLLYLLYCRWLTWTAPQAGGCMRLELWRSGRDTGQRGTK
jgi:hypothetical protein